MKKAFQNCHQQYNSVNEEARARLKHQNLLQELFELQKEFISKKKKLHTVNQRRETLLAEVEFLRQRCSYLSMIKSQGHEYELPQDSVQLQNRHLQSKTTKNHTPAPLRKEKKPKNYLINGKRVGKKNISWQDQMALTVQ